MDATVPLAVIVVAAVIAAGCLSTGATGPSSAPARPPSVSPGDAPRFAQGDVVRLPEGDPNAGMLITGYSRDRDQYSARGVGRVYYAYGGEDGVWVWLDVAGTYPRDRVDMYSVLCTHIADPAIVRDSIQVTG